VAIVMPQCFETAVAYMAVLQMGAVAMPLSLLFGPDALEYRLQRQCMRWWPLPMPSSLDRPSGSHASVLPLAAHGGRRGCARAPCKRSGGLHSLGDMLERVQHAVHVPVDTLADDPAILIYTSGTTGNPKGALLAHRALIGNLSGFVASQNWFGFDPHGDGCAAGHAGRLLESPADWAWTGGLMDALLPTLYFGRPIVAYNGRFSARDWRWN
jgi:acetyl-CoA synthetase